MKCREEAVSRGASGVMTDDGMVSLVRHQDNNERPDQRTGQRTAVKRSKSAKSRVPSADAPAIVVDVRPETQAAEARAAAALIADALTTEAKSALASKVADEAGALASVIALDIIPRLLMGHRVEERTDPPRVRGRFTDIDRASFLSEALELSAPQLSAKLREMMMWGHDLDSVLLDLMAPVARMLGEMWERDSITFIDVTLAVQKMQQVLRDICQSVTSDAHGPHALLLPAPGESHSFGLVIVSELFRKRGWYVAGGLPVAQRVLVNMVNTQPYAVVGFSLSNHALLGDLKAAIKAVRKSSTYREVLVIVGGSAFDGKTHLAAEIGADAAFADAAEVIEFADKVAARFKHAT
jgi:MerR family transcriptional regulator, light-induced transcriptional regulator